MTSAVLVPLFVGGVELLMVGAVILVLVFGSKATDMAREAGSAAGKVRKTRHAAEKEIDDIRGDLEEEIEPVKEDVEEVEEEIEAFEQDVDEAADDLEDPTSGPGTGRSDES
jgi:Sec-independent protein translocase protein TatA